MDRILELLNVPVLMEPDRFNGFLQGWRAKIHVAKASDEAPTRKIPLEAQTLVMGMNGGYAVAPGGVAVVGIFGPIFKGYAPYYADQSDLRAQVRQAANDPNVNGIMFLIDSPGGSVAGTADLADEIAAAGKQKPTMAYIEDCGCSAAYWIAASCKEIYANESAIVGSIGVVTALMDMSKMAADMGIKVIPIVTGKFKAVGMPGTEVKPEDVAYVQALIDSFFDDFVNGVAKGRGIRGETVRKMEAKVFKGEQAVEQKLIDGVMSSDKAFGILAKAASGGKSGNRKAKALIEIEEMEN